MRMLARLRAGGIVLGTLLALGPGGPLGSGWLCAQTESARADLYGDPLPQGAVARLGSLELAPEGEPPRGHTRSVYRVLFSPDGKTLATHGGDNDAPRVRVWDVATARQLHALPNSDKPMAYSPDGGTLLTGGRDDVVHVWDAASGQELRVVPVDAELATFLPDGKSFVVSAGNRLAYYAASDGAATRTLQGEDSALALSPDGGLMAYSSSRTSPLIRVWDLGGEKRRILRGNDEPPSAVTFSPDGYVMACGDENRVVVWELSTGRQLYSSDQELAHEKKVLAIAFSPEGRFMASGGSDHTVRIWELASGKQVSKLTGHTGIVSSLDFSPDGRLLATGSVDRTVLLWDVSEVTLRPPAVAEELTDERLAALWTDLDSPDAAKAYGAIGILASVPDVAVPFVAGHVNEILTPDHARRVAKLVSQLDEEEFTVREAATQQLIRELRRLGDIVRNLLLKELRLGPSLEADFRIRRVLATGEQAGPSAVDARRMRRVVHLLWRVKTPPARQLLESMARDFPSDEVNRDAQSALERLGG